ncbi:MAG: haloalkane dehalogenase [Pseudomonadaceae bacterium]|nr:haloalkane dehalogenase [Pseudomonadaceae bacterium]
MEFLRTPDSAFAELPGYPFEPNYVAIPSGDGSDLRMHYVDEGEGETVLCLHGQPSWSYLYRKMIPLLTQAGYRVIAPDLIGFGRSDKPLKRSDYTYAAHVGWLTAFIEAVDLNNITLVCQDWGGLLGLRAVAALPDRFARVVTANTALPDASNVPDDQISAVSEVARAHYEQIPEHQDVMSMGLAMAGDDSGFGFLHWVKFCDQATELTVSDVLNFSTGGILSAEELAAYDAPYPDDAYKAGPRQFPSLVPIVPDNPAVVDNRAAWAALQQWQKPFLTAFGDSDPITAGNDIRFQDSIPGAKGQAHTTLKGGGHFLQEQVAAPLSAVIDEFIRANPIAGDA